MLDAIGRGVSGDMGSWDKEGGAGGGGGRAKEEGFKAEGQSQARIS